MMRFLSLTALLLSSALTAQHTVLMIADDERTLALDAPEIDFMRDDEIYSVTPLPGLNYVARPFLPMSLAWHYVGDLDGDAQYVETSTAGPGAALDALFVKFSTTGLVSPRDVDFSSSTTSSQTLGISTADVVRYAAPGVQETFVSASQLETATGGSTLNLDALCQSATGDLFLSFSSTETLAIGSGVEDGDLLMIPGTAITYDIDGNVASIVADSVVRLALEDDLIAMVNNSGFRTSVGGTVSTSFELSGLELDPAGGTWVSTVDRVTAVPNLLFCWSDFSNDGAIVSTSGGGSFAVINGVAMASGVATQGDQLGWLPDTTGADGPEGLALVPLQPEPYAVLNYPRNLHTQGSGTTYLQFQVSGGTPLGFSLIALSVESAVANGAFPELPAVAPFFGSFGLTAPEVVGIFAHDAIGNTSSMGLVLATPPLSGLNVAVQALDVTTFQLSTPGGLSFL